MSIQLLLSVSYMQADVLSYTTEQANSYLICYLCEIYKKTASMFIQNLLK